MNALLLSLLLLGASPTKSGLKKLQDKEVLFEALGAKLKKDLSIIARKTGNPIDFVAVGELPEKVNGVAQAVVCFKTSEGRECVLFIFEGNDWHTASPFLKERAKQ